RPARASVPPPAPQPSAAPAKSEPSAEPASEPAAAAEPATHTRPIGDEPPAPPETHYDDDEATGSIQRADAEAAEPTQPQPDEDGPVEDRPGEDAHEPPELDVPQPDDVTISAPVNGFDEMRSAPATSRPPPPPSSRGSSAPPPAWGTNADQPWAPPPAHASENTASDLLVAVDDDELIVDD